MSDAIEVRVPDIGDFKDVPVIEVLVKNGDRIKKNDPLIVLESDKASMDVPADREGVVQDVKVKVGDKVSEGSAIVSLAAGDGAAKEAPAPTQPTAAPEAKPAPAASPAPRPAPPPSPAPAQEVPTGDGMVHAGPSIRRFARELGVDLAQLRGSGPNG
ncbi:MAG: E3 binding domain-containing protein, partial [Candidatus Eremiobacteraeota bacterium]|nr:E3 binding domain-containing protein [Candidatus Eremiobacteraeota bacterium]